MEVKVEVVAVAVARQPITCCSYSLSIAMATFRATFVAGYHDSEVVQARVAHAVNVKTRLRARLHATACTS